MSFVFSNDDIAAAAAADDYDGKRPKPLLTVKHVYQKCKIRLV